MSFLDIVTNVVSDFVFVLLISLLLTLMSLLFRYGRLGKARQFFGFHQQAQIKIYVSGFGHPGVKTERVVNALEYEAAVEIKHALQRLPGNGFFRRLTDYLARLIGQDPRFPEPDIEVSPLHEVKDAPYLGSIILIGGPVSNQLSKFYLQGSPQFRFDEEKRKYQRRDEDGYQDMESSDNVAIVEKRVIGEQVVILAHGFGEEQTKRAIQHLINHWERLYKQHGKQEFGICV